MLTKSAFALALLASASLMVPAASAQDFSFSPLASCSRALESDAGVAAFWAFGYLANRNGRPRPVSPQMVESFLDDFTPACEAGPDRAFVEVLDELIAGLEGGDDAASGEENTASDAAAGAGPEKGEASQAASRIIQAIQAPDANLNEILMQLRPTPEDVRTVFPEPMASNLIEQYERLFGEMLMSEEFPPPPYEVSASFSTTRQLGGDPLLDNISGGFKDVLNKFLIDAPFGSLDIAFPQVNDSMGLHGLIYVNGRWTLMMRPWRGLPD